MRLSGILLQLRGNFLADLRCGTKGSRGSKPVSLCRGPGATPGVVLFLWWVEKGIFQPFRIRGVLPHRAIPAPEAPISNSAASPSHP